MTEEQVFLAVLDLPDDIARAAYLDEACGTNAEQRRQVEALLAAHFKSGEFMNVPAPEQIDAGSGADYPVTIQSDAMPHDKNQDDEADGLEFLAPATRPDSLGRIGHYEVLQVLGKGGFGIVFRAFDDMLQRVVAIKVMAPQLAATSPARKRFLREARSSAQVRHENVVQVYEVNEVPLPYLAMEFIPGETLQQRLDRTGPLDVQETLRIGRQIAEGLAAAHATDLIHRDIKPGNVLLEGSQHKVKITDFGLARAADDASMTQSGMIAGTPMYMAPEQALGQTLDQRADLFSLGSVLYQAVAGRAPFRANTTVAVLKRVAEDTPRPIREVIPETPQWLCDIITKLHAKNPEDRYQSAREVADVLADCEAQLKTNSRLRDFSRIPRSKQPTAGKSGRRKWVAASLVFLALAGGAILAAPLLLSSRGTATVQERVAVVNVEELDGKEVRLRIAGKEFVFDRVGEHQISLPVGRHQAEWVKAGQPALVQDVYVSVNGETRLTVRAWPVPPDADGWVQLFNGKDLTGWKTPKDQPGNWRIENGILIGSGPQSYLFTERNDYEDFHLRVEARLNAEGDSGVIFRTPFWESLPALRQGYEAQMCLNPKEWQTGTINCPRNPALGRPASPGLTRPNEWFLLEIIVRGNALETKVNGQTAVKLIDAEKLFTKGHIALQQFPPASTVVHFRKIEIKELPPEEPGWVQLFNGKDLTGWFTVHPKCWAVEKGEIVGTSGADQFVHLAFQRTDYQNFHMRAEVKINAGGDSGIFFRNLYETGGYEAQINAVNPTALKTGSLGLREKTAIDENWRFLHKVTQSPVPADTWFTYEVIANGSEIALLIDGKEVVRLTDRTFDQGGIWLDMGAPQTVVHFRKIEIKELPPSESAMPATFKNTIGMEFVKVPKGKSWLGGTKDNLGDQEVEIPDDFYMGKYEVTQGEWQKVMGKNPSAFSRKGSSKDVVKDVSDADLKRFPVENVSRDQLTAFFDKLNKLDGEPGWEYRLPTELEWEYACRGGPMADQADSAFDFYFARPTNSVLRAQANFNQGLQGPCKVGSYEPNALGLCDMHGNVGEWCEPDEESASDWRPVRGGGWQHAASDCGAAKSSLTFYYSKSGDLGTRLVRARIGTRGAEVHLPVGIAPFPDADVERIAALPAAEQVKEVKKELTRRNPKFDGNVVHKIEDGVVTELRINSDQVMDISPIRVWRALRVLDCRGTYDAQYQPNGLIADLTPLEGMNLATLTHLYLNNTKVTDAGFVCFKDCQALRYLDLSNTKVTDQGLASFKGCTNLRELHLWNTKLTGEGLAYFKDCKGLTTIVLNHTSVRDAELAQLNDFQSLASLELGYTQVSDAGLTHFQDCKTLRHLYLHGTDVSDAGLVHFKSLPLTLLWIDNTGITDLSPLQGMPLEDVRLTPNNITKGLDILRDMKSLKTIGIEWDQFWPAAEFWERYDKGEFKE